MTHGASLNTTYSDAQSKNINLDRDFPDKVRFEMLGGVVAQVTKVNIVCEAGVNHHQQGASQTK